MKKLDLSFMAVMIITLVIVLILSAMAVFSCHNEVLSVKNQKDAMLNFNIKHSHLLDGMLFNVKQYMETNDTIYKTEFYSIKSNYMKNDIVSVEDLRFNSEEEKLYNEFNNNFHEIIDTLSTAISANNLSFIIGKDNMITEFDSFYSRQNELMAELSGKYIERLNLKENEILIQQKYLEHSLITISLLLLIVAGATFYQILRENNFNLYFSKLYNTVVENNDGGIAILDKQYHFDYMNPKYKEILGITAENINGKSLHDIFNLALAEIIENAAYDSTENEGKFSFIIGGKKKNIVYSFFTIDDEYGNSKYVHLIRDTSKTEELQQRLKKQLVEINFYSKAKDSFIANFSHEIKTPINAILGMVHFLKRSDLSEDQIDLVKKIETSSDILLTIINDVLDLSKIKSNSLSLYPSDFSLKTVLNNVEDMFSNLLSQKGIEWKTEYDFDENLCLHLDKTRFIQVLVNLVNNAYKFTDSGYIKLSIATLSNNTDSVLLHFCVEDTGLGIAEKDISKLFREFEQLENHLTKQHQGTGLGLFISKSIIESMDGHMWVKSTRSKGSKFFFTIAAHKALGYGLETMSNTNSTDPLDGAGRKALVVEDTDINAEVAVRLLADINISCDTAKDGIAAIQTCKSKPLNYYNVILMDIHMPNMDGYTASHILKKEMGIVSPIIALTASEINDTIRAEQAGIIESFLLKPFKADALYKAISPYFQFEKKTLPDPVIKPSSDAVISADTFSGRTEAIKNLGGNELIYNKHINKFKANYADSAEHISSLLNEKNFDEARRLAHSIKGLSGTLGMLNVMDSSAKLEHAILKGEGYDLSAELENFDKNLRAAIEII
ncbi:MAG: ATP-binding protein [Eubacteriales bacterium]|nr:ATP-binding protein [Eubacteriales bacterium]